MTKGKQSLSFIVISNLDLGFVLPSMLLIKLKMLSFKIIIKLVFSLHIYTKKWILILPTKTET